MCFQAEHTPHMLLWQRLPLPQLSNTSPLSDASFHHTTYSAVVGVGQLGGEKQLDASAGVSSGCLMWCWLLDVVLTRVPC